MADVVLCTHPPLNPAVQRCCDIRNQLIERSRSMRSEDLPEVPTDPNDLAGIIRLHGQIMVLSGVLDQNLAYRSCMPELVGRRNIKNFIACVTHGLAIGAIDSEQARNMLYAARTASLATVKRIRKKKLADLPAAPSTNEPEISPNDIKSVE